MKNLKHRFATLLKILFVFGLLYFLAQKGFISVHETARALERLDLVVPAFLTLALTTVMGALRWQWLLRAQGIHLNWRRTLQLTMIGAFFNIALPGAVSGDFVKAFYVGKEIGGDRARAFGSILFDRVAGLSALVLVSAIAFLIGIKSFWNSPLRDGVQFVVAFAALGVVVFYGYLFLVREHHDPLLILLRSIGRKYPKLDVAKRTYEGLRHYHSHRWTVFKVLLLSAVIHLMIGWIFLQFALALGQTDVPLLSIYVIVPLGLLVTAVPIFPAGVGTGHAAFLYLFGLIGSQRGADIFSLFALSSITISGLGGLVYLQFRTHEPKPTSPDPGNFQTPIGNPARGR